MNRTVKDKHVGMRDFLFNKYKKMTFSRKECAEILGVSLQTLDRLTKNKKIESMGVSRYVLFSIEEIAKIISGVKSLK
ncbi:helix-turn-helix domain-containing protein [Campylobacter jejuni]|uniref:helix-turn-helix domain-containing protein n=1 Tax=Campylobacter TaxID=194 RepID=UPI0008759487|nr:MULTISPECIES: helix-turn-helix domain-containing protein [Campylobacter]EIP5774308.1 helix-turn-helix domain-containing protein [Campylobacter jejuni]EKQ0706342.1 helix-turn-helix domain-containing protein [Campylobacter jejuni]EKY7468082.1 helix-turn-helix domain-containing protein [Campylobacter jejuni]ELK3774673.1 helix-turn-helix domain-containing protein [Campylobacter jejuni]MDP8333681.1 helix-turn-helix domain-containing protein [Campylobacter jejuni]